MISWTLRLLEAAKQLLTTSCHNKHIFSFAGEIMCPRVVGGWSYQYQIEHCRMNLLISPDSCEAMAYSGWEWLVCIYGSFLSFD